MADLTITPADVKIPDPVISTIRIAGEAINAGELFYLDALDSGKAKLAFSAGTAAQAACVAMALNNAVADQPISGVQLKGILITITAGATKGVSYALSVNPGKVAPVADLIATNFVTDIAVASLTTELRLDIEATGIQL